MHHKDDPEDIPASTDVSESTVSTSLSSTPTPDEIESSEVPSERESETYDSYDSSKNEMIPSKDNETTNEASKPSSYAHSASSGGGGCFVQDLLSVIE